MRVQFDAGLPFGRRLYWWCLDPGLWWAGKENTGGGVDRIWVFNGCPHMSPAACFEEFVPTSEWPVIRDVSSSSPGTYSVVEVVHVGYMSHIWTYSWVTFRHRINKLTSIVSYGILFPCSASSHWFFEHQQGPIARACSHRMLAWRNKWRGVTRKVGLPRLDRNWDNH